MSERSLISTHVLDAANGAPAQGVSVSLSRGDSTQVASGITDDHGRIADLGPPNLPAGHYRLTFDSGRYFAAQGTATFYPTVDIVFEIVAGERHYHVPILLSPFAFTTYRGS